MERYIGLDVHAASCTLAVISHAGRRVRDFPVETNGQALVEAVRIKGSPANGDVRHCNPPYWKAQTSRILAGSEN